MGDSDEEYSHNRSSGGGGGNGSFNNSMRKNRDKFHRERDDQSSNPNQSGGYQRRDWNDDRANRGEWKSASNRQQGGYSGGGGSAGGYPRKYQSSHDTSPPPQKRRKDLDGSGHHTSPGQDYQRHQNEPDHATQPPLLSFKHFLQQQDDNISDEDAIKKYNDYKIEFKKTQINNFFLEHKEEEWFKSRYHPDENHKRRNEQNKNVVSRLEVFMDLMNKGWLNDITLDIDKSKQLIRFLDACVIKLEGGGDEDVTRLLDGEEKTEQEPAKETNGDSSPKKEEQENGNDNQENGSNKRKAEDSGSESGAYTDSDSDNEEKTRKKKSRNSKSNSKPPSQLHKTASIFMRNLAPSVTKQDLESLCKQYDGFKRVALSDPAPERGFYRRGWITFESNVDVKKICWNLQNIKVKDSNPGAIVNRELTSRIRPCGSLVTHQKRCVKNDLKIAMNIIQNFDKKWNLWQEKRHEESKQDDEEPKEDKDDKDEATKAQEEYQKLEESGFSALTPQEPLFISHEFNGSNPILENITDYLVEEADAEESELLGGDEDGQVKSTNFELEVDENYLKALDKLVLYLRVVHSIDFYNSIEYQQEDSMPNRLGIMFVRPSANSNVKLKQDDIEEYSKLFESKMKPYIEYKDKIDVEMAKKLGLKDRRDEIEKFVKTNTQELAPDRWLCPLSGKRFKGPEFIRKHLFYKHMEKIVEVKKEVEYFNNYLFDPKRPQLPEHPSNRPQGAQSNNGQAQNQYNQYPPNQSVNYTSPGMMNQPMMGYGQIRQQNWGSGSYGMPDMMQGYNQSSFSPQFGYQGYQGGGFKKPGFQGAQNQGNFQRRQREMIQYKDLDAPEDA